MENKSSSLFDFIKSNWQDIFKPITVLALICVITTLALSVTNAVTADRITDLEKQTQKAAMKRLFKADSFTELKLDKAESDESGYSVKQSGEIIGYVFTTIGKGYGGDVTVMTAVNTDGSIKAVEVIDVSNETPGLGQNTKNKDFYSQYSGLSNNISVVKNGANAANNEVDAVTGATISSKAVTGCVNKAITYFEGVTTGKKGVAEDE